ncbi:hypothetical protein [Streptomyces djakartensis]|uniref:Secreted protein n=1 Tax=Streptomyces djakartensis TaxID=68193 RepID=A0ABQ2ZNS3_9ACTN|nr:hypothetical protein [Streptomyces djakartensis]GGY18403.1 hypothetical protein GCM10010384_25980 [Streptomyces djakartensis]
MRRLLSALAAFALAWVAIVTSPGTAAAAGTPRAQFWDATGYQSWKLDKDVWSQGYALIPDLSKEGLSCWFCSGNWDNRISSLSTTGGGQSPVDLFVYTEKGYGGTCVHIPANTQVSDVRDMIVSGIGYPISLNNEISSFMVYDINRPVPDHPECHLLLSHL